jgi:repressor LexA
LQGVIATSFENCYIGFMNRKVPLANWLGELLKKRDLSVRGAAERIGISDVALGNIIKGKSIPDPATVRKIAAWSGLPEEYLLRLSGHLGPPVSRDPDVELTAELRHLRKNIAMKRIPLLGRIPASWPNYQEETLEGYVAVAEEVAKGRDLFALRVRGWSMVEAGIAEGDIIIVDADCRLEIGDIVVADVDGEQTVKRYGGQNAKGEIKLVPANGDMAPFFVAAEHFRCIGVAIQVHKDLKRRSR